MEDTMNTLFSAFAAGSVAKQNSHTDAAELDWNPHPAFEGVSLKHLIRGADTNGSFSAHLVRLEPGAEIGDHVHETQWELHEVAGGSGYCVLEGRRIPYEPGVAAVLPEATVHKVRAGEDGLQLLAKFVPALL